MDSSSDDPERSRQQDPKTHHDRSPIGPIFQSEDQVNPDSDSQAAGKCKTKKRQRVGCVGICMSGWLWSMSGWSISRVNAVKIHPMRLLVKLRWKCLP